MLLRQINLNSVSCPKIAIHKTKCMETPKQEEDYVLRSGKQERYSP